MASERSQRRGGNLTKRCEEDVHYLPARKVWERFDVSPMTLHRWLNNPALRFPRPKYIGRYRYWDVVELEAYERDLPRQRPPRHEHTTHSLHNVAVTSTLRSTPNATENPCHNPGDGDRSEATSVAQGGLAPAKAGCPTGHSCSSDPESIK